jgi:hypothetical protein
MQAPTTSQLRTAIEVLTKFGERLNIEAAYSITQLPETQLGAHYAGSIGMQTIEQTSRIETVTAQLKNWHDELSEQKLRAFAKAGTPTALHVLSGKNMAPDNNSAKNKGDAAKNKISKILSRCERFLFKKRCAVPLRN